MSAGARVPGRRLSLSTRAVQAGHQPDHGARERLGPFGERPLTPPLPHSTNYEYPDGAAADAAATGQAYLYARDSNPTVVGLERALADLEDAEAALAFGSGMAALAAAVFAFAAGGEVVVADDVYGGTTELLARLGPGHAVTTRAVPSWDTEAVRAAVTPKTRLVLVETLSNPLLRVPDLTALGEVARTHGALLVVDSTFTSPALCRPLAWGAHLVVHSLSKSISGHGDVIGGVVLGARDLIDRMREYRKLAGAVLDPFAAWLTLRGLRTLPVRMDRQCATAAQMAAALQASGRARAVHHPGLPNHPDAARAQALTGGRAALVSFELEDGAAARRFYDRVQVIVRAASLGEVCSLLTHPASFSHRGLSPAQRAAVGIREGLLRLAVGLEDPEDLIADALQALA